MKKYLLHSTIALIFLIISLNIIYSLTYIQGSTGKISKVEKKAISYVGKMQKQNIKSIEKEIKLMEDVQKTSQDSSASNGASSGASSQLKYAKIYFKDSVFMGDSQTEPLSYYEILNDDNVLAVKGRNVYTALEDVNEVAKRNPERLFILYGMNDLQLYKSPKQFISNYEKFIKAVKDKLPNTKIYIQSVLPVTQAVRDKIPDYSNDRVAEFNDEIQGMCKKLKLSFIDIRGLLGGSEKLYEPDGVHLQANFYYKLVIYLMKNIG